MIEYDSFPCKVCKTKVIKNYAAAVPQIEAYDVRYYFKCEQCGQLYWEKVKDAHMVPKK